MTDQPPITLDRHRGMAAQKATEIRRLLAEVETNEASLRQRHADLEMQLLSAPATTWAEAAEKASYLLGLLAGTPGRPGSAPAETDRQRAAGFRAADPHAGERSRIAPPLLSLT